MNEAAFRLDLGNTFLFQSFPPPLFLVVDGYDKECGFSKILKTPQIIYDAFKRDYMNIIHFNLARRSVVTLMRLYLSCI